jgi:hypothetical protein
MRVNGASWTSDAARYFWDSPSAARVALGACAATVGTRRKSARSGRKNARI